MQATAGLFSKTLLRVKPQVPEPDNTFIEQVYAQRRAVNPLLCRTGKLFQSKQSE